MDKGVVESFLTQNLWYISNAKISIDSRNLTIDLSPIQAINAIC